MRTRAATFILVLSTVAYLVAVMQRSSLGVAGVDAAERFGTNATQLSTLAVAQLAIYAGLQIPVGMLLDRHGPTRLIAGGAVLMALGQSVVALAPDLGGAVAGRVMVGAGDATTYVSGLRLIASWLPPRRVPIASQWYGSVGQLGQVLSAIPFAALLHWEGWVPAFLSLAACSAIVAVAVFLLIADHPEHRRHGHAVPIREVLMKSRRALARPGTQLGFWSHFTLQFPGTVIGLLWGYPAMVEGLGYEPALASGLLPVLMVAGVIAGPLVGIFAARYPVRRSNLVLALAGLGIGAWVVVLVLPGRPPLWLVIALLAVTGATTIASNIGFDFARTFNPHHSYGSASGIVNVGGFTASFLTMFLIGAVLDLASHSGPREWDAYRAAFWVIPAVAAVGSIGVLIARTRTRTRMAEEDGIVVAPLWKALVRRWRNGRG
ncbi:putative L-galactonate transporter [Pseudoclavibacter triregionum]|nr:putative L-galactonate transporter [Pseudoclavibacter triregionum]